MRTRRRHGAVSPERSLVRRLAPLTVGAAAMLVATTVATVVRPGTETAAAGPELSAALTDVDLPRTRPTFTIPTTVVSSAPAAADDTTDAVPTDTEETDTEEDLERTVTTTRRAPTPPKAPTPPTPPEAPTPPTTAAPAAGGGGGNGTQAASSRGWTQTGGDEFDGSLSSMWNPYNGRGHAGAGRRTEDALSVRDGMLVIRGDDAGNTGGMAWSEDQKYGRWEMRARFPAGDDQYHPVLILWPGEIDTPRGGEIDFAETTGASDKVSFFLHYSSENRQEYAHQNIDITEWHNYAVEWTPQEITGFIDGEEWFSSTDPATFPPGPMHPTIQLDYFPKGGSPEPTEMHVDWMRIYS